MEAFPTRGWCTAALMLEKSYVRAKALALPLKST